jgi:hypothetical protein
MKSEIDQVLLEELPKKRESVVTAFDDGEKRIVGAIAEARTFNVDTSKPFPDGQPALDDVLTSLQASRVTALKAIDDQIANIKNSAS